MVLAALGASGCGTRPGPSSAPQAQIAQFRDDEVNSTLQVRLRGQGDTRLDITQTEVRWPGFAAPAVTDRRVIVVPGQILDIPVPYGAAACAGDLPLEPVAPAAAARIAVTLADGSTLQMGATDPDGVLRRLFVRACADRAVQAIVPMGFEGQVGDDGTISMRVGPVNGAHRVELKSIDGTVIIDLTLRPAEVTGASAMSVPVEVRPNRCDQHAFAEVKQPYLFFVHLTIDGGDATAQPLADDGVRASLLAWTRKMCGGVDATPSG